MILIKIFKQIKRVSLNTTQHKVYTLQDDREFLFFLTQNKP